MRVYLDVIERRFTDAFQEFEKEPGNDDRAHLQLLAGRAALRVLAGELEAAKSAGEEALPLLEARLRQEPDDTFAMTELSWVYLALERNADALRLSKQATDSLPVEKDAMEGPNSSSASRKSRHVRAHLRKPLRGFDVCSQSRRAGQRPSLL
jgi:tetratricopeptide (TPR) repeat protein